jgi:chromosome segregation ATPase
MTDVISGIKDGFTWFTPTKLQISNFNGKDSMMIWRFLSRVGKKQAGNALETFTQAVVAFDPETASAAQISLMEEELDKLGVRVGKAEQAVKKDHEETQVLLTQYNRYMSAAERLETQLQQADDNERVALEGSMAKLVDELERLQPEIDREKQEDAEAESFAAELRQAYDEAAEKLKKSKTQLTQAQRRMEQARIQKERAEERAQSVRETAGLSSSMGGLDTALAAMEKESEKAENSSRAAELKIGAFSKQDITDDPNIAGALKAAEQQALPGAPVTDRLAALRAKKS